MQEPATPGSIHEVTERPHVGHHTLERVAGGVAAGELYEWAWLVAELADELERPLRRMRLPRIRRAAPEMLATAEAQRWVPAEVLRVLLTEEVAGRDSSALATHRARAAFPTGKTFDA